MSRPAASRDRIAEQVASEGFDLTPTEPSDDDYRFIAGKVAEHGPPIYYEEDGYEGRGEENAKAMANLHVYRHVVEGLDSWPEVERHLKTTPGVAENLGLEKPRSRETLRLSWKEQFEDENTREAIRCLAWDLRDSIGWGMDGVLMAMGVDDQSLSYPEFSEEGIRQSAKEDAYERIAPILYDIIDFERAENASVPFDDLADYAGWLARRQDFPESMETYAEEQGLDEEPFDPETFRRAVRNKERERVVVDGEVHWVKPRAHVDEAEPNPDQYDSWEELEEDGVDWSVDLLDDPGGTDDWHSTMEEGIEQFVAELKEEDIIDGEVPVCIDGSIRSWHKHPEGADKRPDGVYQESYFETNYGWKDLTANAIIDGRSVVLANVSKVPGDRTFQALKYLVDRARDLVDVECFYADAEFATVQFCRYIDYINEYYVFRKGHRDPVKEAFKDFTGKADWTDYTMKTSSQAGKGSKEHDTTLFAVEKRGQIGVKKGEKRDEDHKQAGLDDFQMEKPEGQLTFDDLVDDEDIEYVAFVTNKKITSSGIDPALDPKAHDNEHTVWGQAERYRRRWSIETTFRQVKYQFMAKTRSRDLGTRRFFWMVGILLYNGWATMNLLVQEWAAQTFDDDETDPPVRGKVYLEELANFDYG
ncbi:transposase [Natrinema salifodinae]|nr:transposase [Natrinema salifodinae]